MSQVGCLIEQGHLFLEISGTRWLVDTGSPLSCSPARTLAIAGQEHRLRPDLPGVRLDKLTELVGSRVDGLLGTDVLRTVDLVIDTASGVACASAEPMKCPGTEVPIRHVLGYPLLEAAIDGVSRTFVFDTGAHLSYWQHEGLGRHPDAGTVRDFHPNHEPWETRTHRVPIAIGSTPKPIRCGTLPPLIGCAIGLLGAEGILGIELLDGGPSGLFLGRDRIVLPD